MTTTPAGDVYVGRPAARMTMGHFLADIAAQNGEQRAVVFGGETFTYHDLQREARRIARALVGAGVVKGARVAVLLSNRPEWITVAFAVGAVGGVLVPISTFSSREERDYILRHSDAAFLILQSGLLRHRYLAALVEDHPELGEGEQGRLRCAALPNLRRVACSDMRDPSGSIHDWEGFLALGTDVDDALLDEIIAEVRPSDDGIMVYTSGTTARPKAVLHAQRSGVLQSWRFAEQMRLSPDDVVWSAQPFFWTAGFAMSLGATLAAGACLVLQETFEPAEALDLLERERVTTAHAWPHQQKALAEHPSAAARDLSALTRVSAGSPLAQLAGVNPDDRGSEAAYGLSETFTIATSLPEDAPLELRRATHGKPLPGMQVQIVDPESGAALGPGEEGEIAVKGVTLMRGYYKVLPEDFLDENGYFRTKDGGWLDEAGYLHWTGRISGMIKTGGANVSPLEIESALADFPGIKVSAAVGVPHPTLGEVIVLCAVPQQGATIDERALRTHLRAKLPVYTVPKQLLLCRESDLSHTANQKVQVGPLRDLAMRRLQEESVEIDGHRYAPSAS